MNYGYFDDKNKEYVITRPDTPSPWMNYLGNGKFSRSEVQRYDFKQRGRTRF